MTHQPHNPPPDPAPANRGREALLGDGERLFEGTGDELHGLRLVRTLATPRVVHLKFERR